jgi:fructose-1,6-bisphosphatase/sedoheptulose 1,7-bisphosphatase-like protein
MKHLLFDIVEATEAAALAASRYVGSGDKIKIDAVATEAMRKRLNATAFNAEIVIGEGKKDDAPGLFTGEKVGLLANATNIQGCKWDTEYDIAVDPVDGTLQTAKGGYEAMSVIAVGGKDSLLATETFYMNKMAIGPDLMNWFKMGFTYKGRKSLSIQQPVPEIIEICRHILGRNVTVCLLDRPRHEQLTKELRANNCRIKFIQDCDVSGAIASALQESDIDLFLGTGGAPEGVIAAAAMKCLGGYFEGILVDNKEYKPIDNKVYTQEELAKGDVMFGATGITNGSLLRGVCAKGRGFITNSILIESATKSLKRVKSYYEC